MAARLVTPARAAGAGALLLGGTAIGALLPNSAPPPSNTEAKEEKPRPTWGPVGLSCDDASCPRQEHDGQRTTITFREPRRIRFTGSDANSFAVAVLRIPLERPATLGRNTVPVAIRYRTTDRRGWAAARVDAWVDGDVSSGRQKRWFAVARAAEGAHELRLWAPAGVLIARDGLTLRIGMHVEAAPGGSATVVIDQIEVGA